MGEPSMEKRFDLVVFGATGFTGKHAALEAYKVCKTEGLTWAIAGRSQKKLNEVLEEIKVQTGDEAVLKIPVIVAELSDEGSLVKMTSQARIIVNCCGPYRFYGERVIKACIETKTHHVDVSGEPQFIETMQLEYNKAASDAGVYIISACGFDSIPNDMGVVFLSQHFKGTLNSVESYLSSSAPKEHKFGEAGLNYGTWESLVHSLAHHDELAPLRAKIYPTPLPRFKPKLKPRFVIHKNENEKWCLPFPGADNSIVYRTQRHFYEAEEKRPVQFRAYVAFPRLYQALAVGIAAVFLYFMTLCSCTRNFLLNHPRLCSLGMVSKEGPSEETIKNTKFSVTLIGSGWDESVADLETTPPNKKLVAKVSGVNPGYGATVTGLVYSAVTVLKESDKIPLKGGVLTTGQAFSRTNLIKKLKENDFNFEIVDDSKKE